MSGQLFGIHRITLDHQQDFYNRQEFAQMRELVRVGSISLAVVD
jgi:hypothetical protein